VSDIILYFICDTANEVKSSILLFTNIVA